MDKSMKLQRRHFLQLATLVPLASVAVSRTAAAGAEVGKAQSVAPNVPFPTDPDLHLFTQHQREVLTALAETALPTSGALGAARFIEQILSAFDFQPPRIHHDGTNFIPLSRTQERAWRLRIFGSKGAGGGPNDSALGVTVGLREEVHAMLDQADKLLANEVYPFSSVLMTSVWAAMPIPLQQRMVELAVQATVGHPAYGGNLDRGGWKMIFFEGDSLPQGYSQYDAAKKTYRERADAPLSTPNPGADPMPVSWITAKLLDEKGK